MKARWHETAWPAWWPELRLFEALTCGASSKTSRGRDRRDRRLRRVLLVPALQLWTFASLKTPANWEELQSAQLSVTRCPKSGSMLEEMDSHRAAIARKMLVNMFE